jgi:REP element-mobilizing transposase RayT
MANTYSQIYLHCVFTVRGRANLIHGNWKDELYKYICGIVSGNNQKVYAINGMPDHIHLLLSIKPDCTLSDLMRDIKASSSKWINEKKFVMGKFQWQEGVRSIFLRAVSVGFTDQLYCQSRNSPFSKIFQG